MGVCVGGGAVVSTKADFFAVTKKTSAGMSGGMSLLDLKFANFSEIRQDEVRNFCLQSIILLRTTAPTDLTLWLLHRSALHDNNFPAYSVYVIVPPSIAF